MPKGTLELLSETRQGSHFRIFSEHLFQQGPHTKHPHGITDREVKALPGSSKPLIFNRMPRFRETGSSVHKTLFNQQITCLNQAYRLSIAW